MINAKALEQAIFSRVYEKLWFQYHSYEFKCISLGTKYCFKGTRDFSKIVLTRVS